MNGVSPTGIPQTGTLYYYIQQQAQRRDAIGASARLMLAFDKARTEYSYQQAIVAKYKDDPATCQRYLDMLADLIDARLRKAGRAIHTPGDDWEQIGTGAHRRRIHRNLA